MLSLVSKALVLINPSAKRPRYMLSKLSKMSFVFLCVSRAAEVPVFPLPVFFYGRIGVNKFVTFLPPSLTSNASSILGSPPDHPPTHSLITVCSRPSLLCRIVFSSFFRVPYEVVKQRLQVGQYPTTIVALQSIYREVNSYRTKASVC